MADIIERLEEYNKDWRTRAASATEVADAIAEIKKLRARLHSALFDECPCMSADGQHWNSKS